MVRGARSGSSSGRRLSSGRGSSTASASGPFVPPPLAAVLSSHASYASYPCDRLGSIYASSFYGRPSASAPPVFLAGASTMPEVEDDVNLQEGGGSFYDGTLREESYSQQKTEKYVEEEKQPQLDPEV
ncbi:hypothetical protein Taro_044319 [Colocasia esculenta]|uniref:Uncharacterized protein n=1 Tax=Colocasia esculenta TaxID=4460 RepID=A0A843X5B6_COLES|nr:hypothetical protein [Colocasia esculenta]